MNKQLPVEVYEAARRIAAANGTSVAVVVERFLQVPKKSRFNRDDFFWLDSDISLRAKNVRSAVGRGAAVGGLRRSEPANQDGGLRRAEPANQDGGLRRAEPASQDGALEGVS